MTTTHAEAAGADAPWPAEWWERWVERRAAWAARHAVWLRRLLIARLVLLDAVKHTGGVAVIK